MGIQIIDHYSKAKALLDRFNHYHSIGMQRIQSGEFCEENKAIKFKAPAERFAVVIEESGNVEKISITNPNGLPGEVANEDFRPLLSFVFFMGATPGAEYGIKVNKSPVSASEKAFANMTLMAMKMG